MKLKLDLHDVYNRGQDIDRALRAIIDQAEAKKAPLVEIIPGKGSAQLKKHVLRFLEQKEIKAKYHRIKGLEELRPPVRAFPLVEPWNAAGYPDAHVGHGRVTRRFAGNIRCRLSKHVSAAWNGNVH